MFEKLQVFFFQIGYLFSHMDGGDYLDILLVTSLFFIAFQALYQTRALQLLRGVIIYAVFGVVLFLNSSAEHIQVPGAGFAFNGSDRPALVVSG